MTNVNPPLRLVAAYHQLSSNAPEHLLRVPGREMWLAARAANADKYHVLVPDLDARTTFDVRSARANRTTLNRPLPNWSRYCAKAVLLLHREGNAMPGMDVVVVGDEPTGPRYDYALGMAILTLAHTMQGRDCDAACLIEAMDRA